MIMIDRIPSIARWSLASIFLPLMFVHFSPVQANPSSRHPEQGLAAHGTIAGAKELVQQLYQLYDEEAKLVAQTYAKRDDPTSFSDRQISKSAGRLWQGQRDAKRLQLMGEPAGYDLSTKLQLLAMQVYQFGQAYRGTPRGNQLAQRIQAKLAHDKPQMPRFLQQAQNALQANKLEVFETQMEKKGRELNEQLVFFNASGRRPFDEDFNGMLARGDAVIERQRMSEYSKLASQRIAAQLSLVTVFGDEGKRIAAEIAKDGTAQLGEGTTGGPAEAFAFVGSQWGSASAALLRANGLRWAFPNAPVDLSVDANELKSTALTALAMIVDAAAQSTETENVQSVYSDLLEAISVLDRRNGIMSEVVRKACGEGMARLASKDPDLPARVAAYERATAEVLRWRKAYASQQASHLGRNASRADAVLGRKGETDVTVRPPYVRPPHGMTVAAPPQFTGPADWMVQEAGARLVGQAIIEDGAIRLSPTSRIAVIPYSYSHYANLPVPLASETERLDLFSALLVDDEHRPLTIDAADAVSSANAQDYETVMGEIETLHLESIVTRMIGLPDVAYPLVSLGNGVLLNDQISPFKQTCWRLDLRPLWARHLYFTVSTASR